MSEILQTTTITREAARAKSLALATSAVPATATSAAPIAAEPAIGTSTSTSTATTATAITTQIPEENICNDYRKYYLFPITIILIGLFIASIIVCSQLPEEKQKEKQEVKDNGIKSTYFLSSLGLISSLSLLFIMIFKCNPKYNEAVAMLTVTMGPLFLVTCIIFIDLLTKYH